MILVTSGNGKTGRRVIAALADRGLEVRAIDISPQAFELKELGAQDVVIGDMGESSTMNKALDGVDMVVHIGPPLNAQESDLGKAVVDEAANGRVKHFLLFSVTHPQISALLNHQNKLIVEEHLINSRLSYTILQPMHYMQNVDVPGAVRDGALLQMYDLDTRLSLVDMNDVAEAAAGILMERERHVGATYELCASDYLSTSELAHIIGQESGRPDIVARFMPPEDFLALPFMAGITDYGKEVLRRLFAYYGRHGIIGNANVLTWLLGRAPTTFREYVRREMGETSRIRLSREDK